MRRLFIHIHVGYYLFLKNLSEVYYLRKTSGKVFISTEQEILLVSTKPLWIYMHGIFSESIENSSNEIQVILK